MWEEVIKNVGDAKVKANLQSPSHIWEIDSRCLKGHHLLSKKDKEDTQWKYHNKASKKKAKFQTPSTINQP